MTDSRTRGFNQRPWDFLAMASKPRSSCGNREKVVTDIYVNYDEGSRSIQLTSDTASSVEISQEWIRPNWHPTILAQPIRP